MIVISFVDALNPSSESYLAGLTHEEPHASTQSSRSESVDTGHVSHRGLGRAVEAVMTVTSHDESRWVCRSVRGFGLQMEVTLAGIEHWREIEID